jgi:hypothetical protein
MVDVRFSQRYDGHYFLWRDSSCKMLRRNTLPPFLGSESKPSQQPRSTCCLLFALFGLILISERGSSSFLWKAGSFCQTKRPHIVDNWTLRFKPVHVRFLLRRVTPLVHIAVKPIIIMPAPSPVPWDCNNMPSAEGRLFPFYSLRFAVNL